MGKKNFWEPKVSKIKKPQNIFASKISEKETFTSRPS